MEFWIDPTTKRIMAQYSTKYTGTVWQSKEYVAYDEIEPWMLPHEDPPFKPKHPEKLILKGDDGQDYVISVKNGSLSLKKQVP